MPELKDNSPSTPFGNFANVAIRQKPWDFLYNHAIHNDKNRYLFETDPSDRTEDQLLLINCIRHPDRKKVYAIMDQDNLVTCAASTMLTSDGVDGKPGVILLNIASLKTVAGQGQMKSLIYSILKDVAEDENGLTFKGFARMNKGHEALAAHLPLIHRLMPDAPIDYDDENLTYGHEPYILELNGHGVYVATPVESWEKVAEHAQWLKENFKPKPEDNESADFQTPRL